MLGFEYNGDVHVVTFFTWDINNNSGSSHVLHAYGITVLSYIVQYH